MFHSSRRSMLVLRDKNYPKGVLTLLIKAVESVGDWASGIQATCVCVCTDKSQQSGPTNISTNKIHRTTNQSESGHLLQQKDMFVATKGQVYINKNHHKISYTDLLDSSMSRAHRRRRDAERIHQKYTRTYCPL